MRKRGITTVERGVDSSIASSEQLVRDWWGTKRSP